VMEEREQLLGTSFTRKHSVDLKWTIMKRWGKRLHLRNL